MSHRCVYSIYTSARVHTQTPATECTIDRLMHEGCGGVSGGGDRGGTSLWDDMCVAERWIGERTEVKIGRSPTRERCPASVRDKDGKRAKRT